MRIGVIGAASIFKNRWLNILQNDSRISLVGVARRKIDQNENRFKQRVGYLSFDSNEVDWVYIPLPNVCHYDVARHYLSLGVNVLIEKPSATRLKDTLDLVSLARLNNTRLLEAFQWNYHSRTQWIKDNLDQINPYLVDIVFTIPHLGATNIRYQKDLEGGAVFDLGSYPCSVISTLFNEEDFQSWSDGYSVDMGGAGIFKSGFRRINFYYAFGKAYESRLILHSNKGRYDIPQPFTAASNSKAPIYHEHNTKTTKLFFADCHFQRLLEVMINDERDIEKELLKVELQGKYLAMLVDQVSI